MKRSTFNLFSLFLFFILVYSYIVSAHLDGGEDKIIDGYLVDFGYSPKDLSANKPIELAFNLLDHKTKEVIEPDNVWVRIAEKDNVIFSAKLFPETKHISFLYTFPRGGTYEIKVRFKDETKKLVETDFKIKVEEKQNSFTTVLSIIAVFVLIVFVSRIRKKRKKIVKLTN
jgi:hypothetical protein